MRALISLRAVIGNPCFSSSSFSFLSATISPVCVSRARKTTPYEPSSIWFNLSYVNTERAGKIGGWHVRGGTHMLCSLLVDCVGRGLGCCVGWDETEERSLLETFERLCFGTRFGEGCVGMSSSSPLSHLERFREGVEDPARIGSIKISGLTVVGVRVTFKRTRLSQVHSSLGRPLEFCLPLSQSLFLSMYHTLPHLLGLSVMMHRI